MRNAHLGMALGCSLLSMVALPGLAWGDEGDGGAWFEPGPAPTPAPPPDAEDSDEPEDVVATPPDRDEVVVVRKARPRMVLGRRGRPMRVIKAYPGEAPPLGYRVGYRSRKELWIPGITLLATGYLGSALSSAAWMTAESTCIWSCPRTHDWGWGFLPLVGPYFIAADSSIDPGWRAAYAIFGVAQDLGLGLSIAGGASKRRVFIYSPETASSDPSFQIGAGNVSFKASF